MAVEPRLLILRGPLSCAEVERAFHTTWPGLRLALFVADHPYWKDHEGKLGPEDLALRAECEVTLDGNLLLSRACARFGAFGLAAEIDAARRALPGDRTLDEESDA